MKDGKPNFKILIVILLLAAIVMIYGFSYLNWRQDKILTASEYMGNSKERNERPIVFYFSINDQTTWQGKIFLPAILIDLYLSKLDLVEE